VDTLLLVGLKGDKVAFENAVGYNVSSVWVLGGFFLQQCCNQCWVVYVMEQMPTQRSKQMILSGSEFLECDGFLDELCEVSGKCMSK
jgi:uncharacterized membrane protein